MWQPYLSAEKCSWQARASALIPHQCGGSLSNASHWVSAVSGSRPGLYCNNSSVNYKTNSLFLICHSHLAMCSCCVLHVSFCSIPSPQCPAAVCLPAAAERNLAAALTELMLCMCVCVCVGLASQAHGVREVRELLIPSAVSLRMETWIFLGFYKMM